ncbi:hypothetical protein KSP40_PGU011422 [Platanthera guangdongensis]|uniref:Uncharacterized protein n=1 Tax=Platanthera guangdongensis TaxID=2320717 RepID=A0ABR2MYG3_9ASPA
MIVADSPVHPVVYSANTAEIWPLKSKSYGRICSRTSSVSNNFSLHRWLDRNLLLIYSNRDVNKPSRARRISLPQLEAADFFFMGFFPLEVVEEFSEHDGCSSMKLLHQENRFSPVDLQNQGRIVQIRTPAAVDFENELGFRVWALASRRDLRAVLAAWIDPANSKPLGFQKRRRLTEAAGGDDPDLDAQFSSHSLEPYSNYLLRMPREVLI